MNKKENQYEQFLEILNQKIENFQHKIDAQQYGIVTEVGDAVAKLVGLNAASLGDVVQFLDDGKGIVMKIDPTSVTIMLFNKINKLKQGSEVFLTGGKLKISVGDELLGRVINPLGESVDDLGPILCDEQRLIEVESLGIMDRTSVFQPLQTGITIIDSLIPIGLGQKQLILGDRQTGKTTIAIDAIINQKRIKDEGGEFAYCVYVAIGKKASEIAKIYELFKKLGVMDNVVIVAATASDASSMQYISPMVGATIAEYFRDKKEHALVVFDDLTKHADAYREISLLMRKTPARGAYPGDIFYLHSKLLERAVKTCDELGGGSVTMLPIIETLEGDISGFIPTNVISITDGQIYMDKDIFFDGQKPAINIGLSVSRIGSSAEHKNMKMIAGSLKGELSQFLDYESFAKSVSELDQETQNIIDRGKLLMSIFKQKMHHLLSKEEMIIILFAGTKGLIKHIVNLEKYMQHLISHIHSNHIQIIKKLRLNEALSQELQKELSDIIIEFSQGYECLR